MMTRLLYIMFLSVWGLLCSGQPLMHVSQRHLNSAYDEQNPVLSPDGKSMFITIGNHPQNMGGKKDPGDIWISTFENNQWSAPVHGGNLINDRAYNAVAGISSSGSELFLHGHYDAARGIARSQGISVSKREGSGWGRPQNVTVPYFVNKSGLLNGHVTANKAIFIFSAETYGTHGVDDLYVCLSQDGKWGEPKNLGPVINTRFQELCPSISEDGRTIFFSSNGRKGMGSFDVFTARRLDDSWTSWTTPVNLSDSVNTSGRDLYFRNYERQKISIYTSTINSDGYGDVRIIRLQLPPDESDTLVIADISEDSISYSQDSVSITSGARDTINVEENKLRIYGKVANSKTGEAVPSQLTFFGPEKEIMVAAADDSGRYEFMIARTKNYTMRIEAHGYVSKLEDLDIAGYEMDELEMNFQLQPVEVGTTVNLKNVLFAQTKADILPESYPELDMVVNFMKENPTVRIELSGHTDSRGIASDNVKLSLQRVNKVKEYLVAHGVEAKRITGRGYGGTKPIASNDSEESRRMNRRVEFTIKRY